MPSNYFDLLCASLISFVLGAILFTQHGAKQPDNRPTKESIAELIRMLGDDDFNVREQATKQLLGYAEDVGPALEAASSSSDPEIRLRAKAILAEIAKRNAEKKFGLILERIDGASYGFDSLMDRMVEKQNYATEERWLGILQLSHLVWQNRTFAGEDDLRIPHLVSSLEYPIIRSPVITDAKDAVRRRIIAPVLRSEVPVTESVVLSNGLIQTVEAPVHRSILIAGKDIVVDGPLTHSLVIASQNVTVAGPVSDCVIWAGGSIKLEAPVMRTDIKENMKGPLCFFTTTMLGVVVEEKMGAVRVSSLSLDTPFSRSPIRAGDFILSIDDSRVTTANDARVALRRAMLRNKATMTVRRGDAELVVDIADLGAK